MGLSMDLFLGLRQPESLHKTSRPSMKEARTKEKVGENIQTSFHESHGLKIAWTKNRMGSKKGEEGGTRSNLTTLVDQK